MTNFLNRVLHSKVLQVLSIAAFLILGLSFIISPTTVSYLFIRLTGIVLVTISLNTAIVFIKDLTT